MRDGSLLDDAALKELYESVAMADYLLLIELVGEQGSVEFDGKVSVVIEDGAVKAA